MNRSTSSAVTVLPIEAELTHPLRHRVLRPHQSPGEMAYPDDHATGALHLGAFDTLGALIGIASLTVESMPASAASATGTDERSVWRLRGMAVVPELQGRGIGAQLVTAAVDEGARLGHAAIWCNARVTAAGFYERLGFEISSEPFEIEGIGTHLIMRRGLG